MTLLPPIIEGACTIVAAGLGAAVVMHQVRAQANQSRSQAAMSERLKLNLRIYDDISAVVQAISSASVKLVVTTHSIESQLNLAGSQGPPEARYPVIAGMVSDLNYAIADALDVVQRWLIIDPRIDVFHDAFNVAGEALRDAFFSHLAQPLIHALPMDVPGAPPWTAPSPQLRAAVDQGLTLTRAAANEAAMYAGDFQTAMQNLLLAELGSGRVPTREPIDPRFAAVSLEKREEMRRYFSEATLFGQRKRQAEQAAREAMEGR